MKAIFKKKWCSTMLWFVGWVSQSHLTQLEDGSDFGHPAGLSSWSLIGAMLSNLECLREKQDLKSSSNWKYLDSRSETLPKLGSDFKFCPGSSALFWQCSLVHAVLWFVTWCDSTQVCLLLKQLEAKLKAIFSYSNTLHKWTWRQWGVPI